MALSEILQRRIRARKDEDENELSSQSSSDQPDNEEPHSEGELSSGGEEHTTDGSQDEDEDSEVRNTTN